MTPTDRASLRTLVFLILAAVLIRLLVCFVLLPRWEESHGAGRFPDGYPYLAQSLLEEKTLGFGPWGGASPTTAKGPGFALWLAPGIAVGGMSPGWLGFWSGVPTLILAWFLGRAVLTRFGIVPAAIGVLALTCHPVAVVLTSRVLPDELYGALGMGGCLALVSASGAATSRSRLALAALSAALLGGHMLARSTGILTVFAILLAGFLIPERRVLALCVVFVALIPPLIWSVRSSRLEGRPVFVNSLAAYNFWVGEAFDRLGSGWTDKERWRATVDLLVEQGAIVEREREGFHYANLTPREVAAMETKLQAAAARLIEGQPLHYLGRCARGVWRFWIQSQSTRRTIQYALVVVPLLALAGIGAWGVWRDTPSDTLGILCLGVIALHNIAYAMILPMGRFSVEVYPHLAWLAAAGAFSLRPRRRRDALRSALREKRRPIRRPDATRSGKPRSAMPGR